MLADEPETAHLAPKQGLSPDSSPKKGSSAIGAGLSPQLSNQRTMERDVRKKVAEQFNPLRFIALALKEMKQ